MHSRWRFTKSREGKRGGPYVKVNHWPSLVVSRQDGFGWRMEVQLLPRGFLMTKFILAQRDVQQHRVCVHG